MKKLIVIILAFFIQHSFAQSNMVKGTKYLVGKYGFSQYSVPKYGSLEFGMCYKEKMFLEFGAYYENGNVSSTQFENYGINVDAMFNVFNLKERIYLNSGLGAVGGYETLKTNKISNRYESFLYGGKYNAEIDILISSKVSLKTEFSQWYLHNSKLGQWYYTMMIGISYNLN
jgi:hypothetical protein